MKKIIAAAIQTREGTIYTLPPPNRHHDIIWKYLQDNTQNTIQGFVTEDYEFVDRTEAMNIARAADQLVDRYPHLNRGANHSEKLFSEDLWDDPDKKDWSEFWKPTL